MPRHDDIISRNVDEHLSDIDAERVEGIAKILAEHLYAQPTMPNEQAEADDNSEWKHTSEANKRIFRSCALEVDRFTRQ